MRILFLQKRILLPPDTGGKIRTLNILRHMARWHEITYLCNRQESDEEHLEAMRGCGVRLESYPWQETPRDSWRFYRDLALNIASPYPFSVAKDYDPQLWRRAKELLATEPYDLVVCDFVQMARNALNLGPVPSVLFQHNVEAQLLARHVTSGCGAMRRAYMALQWLKMRRFEARAGRQFSRVIAVSEQDKQVFQKQYGWSHVRTIDTAVDTDYFSPNGRSSKKGRVVFVGSMDWLPNEDGVRHFVRNIWPEVRKTHPHATFQIVGRRPSRAVQQLTTTAGVEVVGMVPDVRPYLASAAVVVVPLLVGGGTRLKIFEAMAMRRPVVSTSVGAEGLKVTPGDHLVLADTPCRFADAVGGLLGDRHQREQLGRAGRDLVVGHFSAETVSRQFETICRECTSA